MLELELVLNNFTGGATFNLFKASDPVCVTRVLLVFYSQNIIEKLPTAL